MISSAEEFVRLRSSEVRAEYELAANGEASIDVWRDVIERFPDYREWVAQNKTVPVEILTELAIDQDPRVRKSVARKRKLSAELFEQLARDNDATVRNRIIYNAKTPMQLIEFLTNDAEEWVAANARARIVFRDKERKDR